MNDLGQLKEIVGGLVVVQNRLLCIELVEDPASMAVCVQCDCVWAYIAPISAVCRIGYATCTVCCL